MSKASRCTRCSTLRRRCASRRPSQRCTGAPHAPFETTRGRASAQPGRAAACLRPKRTRQLPVSAGRTALCPTTHSELLRYWHRRAATAPHSLRSNLGSVLRDIGDTESAIEAFTRAIQAAPALAPPFVNLGRCFRVGERAVAAAAAAATTTAVAVVAVAATAAGAASATSAALTADSPSPPCPLLRPISQLHGLQDAGRLRDALLCFDKALQLSSGENEEAFVGLHVTRASACVWDQREAAAQSIAEAVARHLARQEVRIGPLQPLHALHLAMPAHAARDAATTYARALTQSTVLLSMPKFRFRAKKPHERLRVRRSS